MKKRIGILACLVIGLTSFFAIELMADAQKQSEVRTPVVTASQSHLQMQQAIRMQQYQQTQSQLMKLYEERQNIDLALETIEKKRAQGSSVNLSNIYRQSIKTEDQLKQRRHVLAAEIKTLESKLNN